MENNNGRGIFYGVIGVATLVVAIIGATFAFFAAEASGTEKAVGGSTVNLVGTLNITQTPDARTNLIPVTETVMKDSYVQTGEGAKAKCKGVSAAETNAEPIVYDLCSPYEFTLHNTAKAAQQVYVTLTTNSNDFTNLYYCIFEGSGSTATTTKTCGAVPATSEVAFNVVLPAATGSMADQTKTYTVVLYVNETTNNQTNDDSGKTFEGTISATTFDGTNNVTGKISAKS